MDASGDVVWADERICKLTIAGDTAWCHDFSESDPGFVGEVISMVSTEEGNLLATGWLRDTSMGSNYFTNTVYLTSDGNKIWTVKDDFLGGAGLEAGVTVTYSDKYVFVCSQVTLGSYTDYYSSLRLGLYSLENGFILYDTLIDLSENDFPHYSAWDGTHFYLDGTYMKEGFMEDPSIVLFKFSIDEPVNVNEAAKESYKITASPSPFDNTLALLVEAAVGGDADINIFSPIGHRVHQSKTRLEKGGNHITVEGVQNWPNGIYFLTVETGGRIYTEKIVKGG